jgi:hypothetical protein
VPAAAVCPRDANVRTLKTFRPGQHGTKRWLDAFGARLLCVRYRYDPATGARVTTVEIEVARARMRDRSGAIRILPGDRRLVRFRLRDDNRNVRAALLQAGAEWRAAEKLWEAPADVLRVLRLTGHVQCV